MNFFQFAGCTLILTTSLSACQMMDSTKEITATPFQAAASPSAGTSDPAFAIEVQTPDQAVKTWWRFIDLKEQANKESCVRSKSTAPEPLHIYLPRVANGEVLRRFTEKTYECAANMFSRDIQEVKLERETRAVVFALVKNVSPIPVGAEPDDYDKEYRKDGFKFKYDLEKSSDGWKVVQVWKYSDTKRFVEGDPWQKLYVPSVKPHYPAWVHEQ